MVARRRQGRGIGEVQLRTITGLAIAGLVLPGLVSPARADVDSEHMFGFTEGTDIGSPFQPEAEIEVVGHAGRASGYYSALSATASLKYPLSESLRLAPAITFTRFDISGVPDFEDRNVIALERLGLELRWRAFDRDTALFGLTFVASPTTSAARATMPPVRSPTARSSA